MQARLAYVFSTQLFANIDAFQITRVELPAAFQHRAVDLDESRALRLRRHRADRAR